MDSKDIEWIFFDLGSTLIDETRPEECRINQAYELLVSEGVHIDKILLKSLIEESATEFAPKIIDRAIIKILGDNESARNIASKISYLHEYENPYDDALEVLSILSEKYKIGIIANQKLGAAERLKKYGLSNFINLCISSAETGLAKPNPRIFKLALEQAGCSPDRSIMVGDRLDYDIRPAKKLGFNTIRMLQGYHKNQIPRCLYETPNFTLANLSELISILI